MAPPQLPPELIHKIIDTLVYSFSSSRNVHLPRTLKLLSLVSYTFWVRTRWHLFGRMEFFNRRRVERLFRDVMMRRFEGDGDDEDELGVDGVRREISKRMEWSEVGVLQNMVKTVLVDGDDTLEKLLDLSFQEWRGNGFGVEVGKEGFTTTRRSYRESLPAAPFSNVQCLRLCNTTFHNNSSPQQQHTISLLETKTPPPPNHNVNGFKNLSILFPNIKSLELRSIRLHPSFINQILTLKAFPNLLHLKLSKVSNSLEQARNLEKTYLLALWDWPGWEGFFDSDKNNSSRSSPYSIEFDDFISIRSFASSSSPDLKSEEVNSSSSFLSQVSRLRGLAKWNKNFTPQAPAITNSPDPKSYSCWEFKEFLDEVGEKLEVLELLLDRESSKNSTPQIINQVLNLSEKPNVHHIVLSGFNGGSFLNLFQQFANNNNNVDDWSWKKVKGHGGTILKQFDFEFGIGEALNIERFDSQFDSTFWSGFRGALSKFISPSTTSCSKHLSRLHTTNTTNPNPNPNPNPIITLCLKLTFWGPFHRMELDERMWCFDSPPSQIAIERVLGIGTKWSLENCTRAVEKALENTREQIWKRFEEEVEGVTGGSGLDGVRTRTVPLT